MTALTIDIERNIPGLLKGWIKYHRSLVDQKRQLKGETNYSERNSLVARSDLG
jgi:hypothetical protein